MAMVRVGISGLRWRSASHWSWLKILTRLWSSNWNLLWWVKYWHNIVQSWFKTQCCKKRAFFIIILILLHLLDGMRCYYHLFNLIPGNVLIQLKWYPIHWLLLSNIVVFVFSMLASNSLSSIYLWMNGLFLFRSYLWAFNKL